MHTGNNIVYEQQRQEFAAKKPQLLQTYDDFHHLLQELPDYTSHASTLRKLVLISEYVFISPQHIHAAIRKNELYYFVDIVYSLFQSSSAAAFINGYKHFPLQLSVVKNSFLQLGEAAAQQQVKTLKLISLAMQLKQVHELVALLRAFTALIYETPKLFSEVFSFFCEQVQKNPLDSMLLWLQRGVDYLESKRTEDAAKFLTLQSKDSRWMLGMQLVVLEDLRKELRLYSSSLLGRTMNVAPLSVSALSAGFPYSDGYTIYLPERIELYTSMPHNEKMYSVVTAIQTAAFRYGSYQFTAFKDLFSLQQRYGETQIPILDELRNIYKSRTKRIHNLKSGDIEAIFHSGRKLILLNTAHENFFFQFPAPDLARLLFRVLEQERLKACLSRKYPGLQEDFLLLNKTCEARLKRQLTREASHIVEKCIAALLLHCLQLPVDSPNLTIHKVLQTINPALGNLRKADATIDTTMESLFTCFNALFDNTALITYRRKSDIQKAFPLPLLADFSPEILADTAPELMGIRLKVPQIDIAHNESEPQALELGTRKLVDDKRSHDLKTSYQNGDLKISVYPEYDYGLGAYKKKHCTILERTLAYGSEDYIEEVLTKRKLLIKQIKKRFLFLQPEELELSRRWYSGDEIHLEDALDFSMSLQRGEYADDRIFMKRVRNIRDIGVAVLIDSSGSTNALIHEQSILDIEKESVLLLASAMHTIGDSFAVYSFHGKGASQINFFTVKEFHEAWSTQTASRIDNIQAQDFNRDGAAIRHAANKLLAQPCKTKLLLMLSDGIPADIDYGAKAGDKTTDYAIEDTRKALCDCRIQGIIPYCITVDKEARAYISHLYGNYNYSHISQVEQLPEKLSKLYLRLTR